MPKLDPTTHLEIDNGDGWYLELRRYLDPATHDPSRPPVLMIPGYAMNSFILAYHPGGPSMVEHLVLSGFDVWTANLRGQGDARPSRGAGGRFGLAELALVDVPAVLSRVRAETGSDVHLIGASLGASLIYAYLAHHPEDHHITSVVAIGGPLDWDELHPMMRLAFTSARLAGAVRLSGTRNLARKALPLLQRMPSLLSVYMNAREVDLTAADQLVNTVEDPVPWINRQVARWVQRRRLVVRGVDVADGLARIHLPLLCILANADGIVPPGAALSAVRAWGSVDTDVLNVGTPERWYAHADLFIGPRAQDEVFEPLAQWLTAHQG